MVWRSWSGRSPAAAASFDAALTEEFMSLSYEPFQRSLAEVFFEEDFLLVDLPDEAAFFVDGFRADAFFDEDFLVVVFLVLVFLLDGLRAVVFFVVDFLDGLRAGAFLVVVFFEHAVDLGEEIGGLGARVDAFAGNFF